MKLAQKLNSIIIECDLSYIIRKSNISTLMNTSDLFIGYTGIFWTIMPRVVDYRFESEKLARAMFQNLNTKKTRGNYKLIEQDFATNIMNIKVKRSFAFGPHDSCLCWTWERNMNDMNEWINGWMKMHAPKFITLTFPAQETFFNDRRLV